MSSQNICSVANPSEIAHVSICHPRVLYNPYCLTRSGAHFGGVLGNEEGATYDHRLLRPEKNVEWRVGWVRRGIVAGGEVGRWIMPRHDPKVLEWIDYVPQETMFWRKRAWDLAGGIDPSFQFALDWDLLAPGHEREAEPFFPFAFRSLAVPGRIHAGELTLDLRARAVCLEPFKARLSCEHGACLQKCGFVRY